MQSRIVNLEPSNLRVEVRGGERDRGSNNFRRPSSNSDRNFSLKRSVNDYADSHQKREEPLLHGDDSNKRLRALQDAPVEVHQRNKRVFGAILGTLQQFKKEIEVKAIPGREEIEHKIDAKLEEEQKVLEEKRKTREPQKDPELVRLEQIWEENKKMRSLFHMTTQIQPFLYWAPNPNCTLPKLEIKPHVPTLTTFTTTTSTTTEPSTPSSSSLKSVVVAPWENRDNRDNSERDKRRMEREKNGDVKMADGKNEGGVLTIVSNLNSSGAIVERHVSDHDLDSEKSRRISSSSSSLRSERYRDSYSEKDRDRERYRRNNNNDKGS